jgi:hypothetical protein
VQKICSKCKELKDESEFYIDPFDKSKKRNICILCCRIYKKQYDIKNHKLKLKKDKIYYNKNKKKILNRITNRLYNNPLIYFNNSIRSNIKSCLKSKGYHKNLKSTKILQCDFTEFKNYIENKFTEGMTWKNMGRYGWHLDHIIPIYLAQTKEEVIELCYYSNFQPMWANENLTKSNKIILEQISEKNKIRFKKFLDRIN